MPVHNPIPEAVIRIRLKTTEEGGRQGPLILKEQYPVSCPMVVDGEYFDCRFVWQGPDRVLHLGETYEVPVVFLSPKLILPRLSPGTPIKLWDGKDFGVGEVVRVMRADQAE